MAILVSTQVTGTLGVTGQATVQGVTASLWGSSSWATNVVNAPAVSTASNADTASWAINAVNAPAPSYTSSLWGTASWATNVVTMPTNSVKAGVITSGSWGPDGTQAGDYLTASVVFSSPFGSANYAVTFGAQMLNGEIPTPPTIVVTGSLLVGGFTASLNDSAAFSRAINYFWMATPIAS